MLRRFAKSALVRRMARLLVATQVLGSLPVSATAAPVAQRTATRPEREAEKPNPPAPSAAPAPPVKVNRTVPKVAPPPLQPRFSRSPSDDEIFRARVFQEPLVPMGRTSPEENEDLAGAVSRYLETGRPEETRPFEQFLYEVTQTGPTQTFAYDANGNLTGDGSRTYEWDASNRLVVVKEGSATVAKLRL